MWVGQDSQSSDETRIPWEDEHLWVGEPPVHTISPTNAVLELAIYEHFLYPGYCSLAHAPGLAGLSGHSAPIELWTLQPRSLTLV